MRTEKSKWRTHEDESPEALHRGGITRSSDEVPEKRMERRVVSRKRSRALCCAKDEGGPFGAVL